MSVTAIPMMGQDLIARQAPIDKKMKAVDSVAPVSYTHLRAHET